MVHSVVVIAKDDLNKDGWTVLSTDQSISWATEINKIWRKVQTKWRKHICLN